MKILVVLPTYNEVENIGSILVKLMEQAALDVLVVDDNSTDGTRDTVRRYFATGRVFMVERAAKLGLGTAYIAGFQWGLQRGYEFFFEMDADNSHNPAAIPFFIKELEKGYDLIIGSRYINNTISVVGWDFKRLLLSKFGNLYASFMLGLRQFTDLTSGYRCYTKTALKAIRLERVKSNGYAFQVEMVYRGFINGLKIAEIPIIFYERESGGSKMSRKIVREAVLLPFRLRLEKIENKL